MDAVPDVRMGHHRTARGMDVWTVLWSEGTFVLEGYLAAIAAAFPQTVVYAVSNVVFLLLLAGPVGKKLERIKKKEGLFQ